MIFFIKILSTQLTKKTLYTKKTQFFLKSNRKNHFYSKYSIPIFVAKTCGNFTLPSLV